MTRNEKLLLIWGALFLSSVVVTERARRGCTSCAAVLGVLKELRRRACAPCEQLIALLRLA